MKKYKYNINNLDCANCAREIEEMLNNNTNFNNAVVNFSTCKISYESDKDYTLEELNTLIKSVEPDAYITLNEEAEESTSKEYYLSILIIALVIGLLGYFLPLPKIVKIILYLISYSLLLYKTSINAIKLLKKGSGINENALITVSCIGALLIGEVLEGMMVITLYTIGKILEEKAINNSRKSIKDLLDIKEPFAYLVDGQKIKLKESPVYMRFIPFFNLLDTADSILEYNYLLDNTIEYLKNENMISLMTQKEREYYKQNPTIKTALFIAEKDYEQRRFGNKIILKGDTSDSVITYYYDFTENSIEILSCTGEITKLDADDIMEITITLLENCLYEYYAKYGGVDKYYQAIMDGREKNSIIIVRGIIEALDEADLEYENQRKLSKKPKDN